MSNARIFLVGQQGQAWIPMVETPYAQEDILQEALAHYPDLLPGDQIDPENPRRWLLVKREVGVPADLGGDSVGWLDHLFLDQDGIPTLVECKRAADTRSRREVVAQMLDYAANAVEYWPMEYLRQAAAETAAHLNRSLDEEIARLTGLEDEMSVESFWQGVERNLRQGKIRLIFVADEIPRKLRRLVEFLNSKMSDVEVLAIEVRQFLGQGQAAMVPRVIGLTEAARTVKQSSGRTTRTNNEVMLSQCTPEAAAFFTHMLETAEARGNIVYWGEKGFSIRARLPGEGQLASFAYAYPVNNFQFYFANLPLSDSVAASLRQELMAFGVLQKSGQYTLKATVTAENGSQLRQVWAFILDQVAIIAQQ